MFRKLWPFGGGDKSREKSVQPELRQALEGIDSKSVTVETLGPTMVITITEHEATSEKVAEMRLGVQAALVRHPEVRGIVVDLQNVEFLDSACLYMLVELLKHVQESGGRIAVATAKNQVQGLFKLTRLDQRFPITRNVLDALAAVERAA